MMENVQLSIYGAMLILVFFYEKKNNVFIFKKRPRETPES